LPRDGAQARRVRRGQVHPPDERPRPVRACGHPYGTGRAGDGLRVRGQHRGRRDPAGVHRPGRAGRQGSARERRARRLSDGGRDSRAGGRVVPRIALGNGVLAGYPMVDVIVELVDGSYHDVDSSEMAFKIAGSMAVKEAARQAHPVLLEPIMDVEVVTPADYMGDVIGDLSARRGKIGGMTQRADAHVVAASVPLSEMFGYSTTLRSMSQGRAIYSMQFSHYQEVPKTKAEEIVSKVKG